MAAVKSKVHVILGTVNQQPALADLNKDLGSGWKVLDVHPGNAGTSNYWLVVIQERMAGSGSDDD